MEDLKTSVKTFSNDYLLEQFIDCQEEYTPDALRLLKCEIDNRKISQEEIDAYLKRKDVGVDESKSLDIGDFVQFNHSFSRTDILLAISVLRDSKVVFYVDNPSSSDTIPLESEATKRHTIHVQKDYVTKAHELLDEHFVKQDGNYSFRYAGAFDRLKSFSFYDLHLTELEAAESIECDFKPDERKIIIAYGKRLLDEVDTVEEKQDRVVFYYDSIEPLLEYISDESNTAFCRSDLLTIMEILQIYCTESDFPQSMNDAVATLLSFFLDS